MTAKKIYDAIIIGGSYAGLAAAMALGRSLRDVLIIDSGRPCNRQTPYSHNFITQDGKTPAAVTALARAQVEKYSTVAFLNGIAEKGNSLKSGFEIETAAGDIFQARKIVFATGIKDIMPNTPGFSECWGISVLHCPYCHGYEVRSQKTGILANGEEGFGLSSLISNWTNDLTLYTNGKSTLTPGQSAKLQSRQIFVVEDKIARLVNENGFLQYIVFKNAATAAVQALYTRLPFEQHSQIPLYLGCEFNSDDYLKIDPSQKTSVPGVFACGDNSNRIRTIANAVAMGTMAGMAVNRELIEEDF